MIRSRVKSLILLSFLLFLPSILEAQNNISVKSFRLLETDLTANLEGTKEIDQNGEVAALIKVITTERGFVFDVGMLGIARLRRQQLGCRGCGMGYAKHRRRLLLSAHQK